MGPDTAPPMTANIYNVMLPRLGVLVRAQVASLGAEVSPPGTEGAFFPATLSFINSHSGGLISVDPERTITPTRLERLLSVVFRSRRILLSFFYLV